MLTKRKGIFSTVVLCCLLMSSCVVSKKKFDQMEQLKNSTQKILTEERKKNKELSKENKRLGSDLDDCSKRLEGLIADSTRLTQENIVLETALKDLRKDFKKLNKNYNRLKSQSSNKIQKLIEELEVLQNDLITREKRLAEVEAKLSERDTVMMNLRERLNDALFGFKDKGLTVEMKDNKVYVSLSNQLLFESGSTKIDENGQAALKEVAKVLVEQKDLAVMVEGHTDDVPVSNLGDIKDNWDLSVMRSTEVVRLLVGEGLEPERVIPAGRGEYLPVVAEQTPEARAANRRTDIILSPKLDVLYELINQQR